MKRITFLLTLFAVLAQAAPLVAQTEHIASFDSWIAVNADNSMQVKEKIQVESAGIDIVHGIYRDFPTHYKDGLGNRYSVTFAVVSVLRDGNTEPYHTKEIDNGVRVYFGRSDYELPPGIHTYEFTYRTSRQLGFFPDHDELYWNVTGNGWKFPIDAATATVLLPAKVRNVVTDLDGFTGYAGEKNKAFTAKRDEESNPVFHAEALAPEQGLTIVVSWPKGLIAPPTSRQKREWFIEDNKSAVFGAAGLILTLLYYLAVWSMVGKDPAAGTIVPLYEPPDSMSPAAMRYLEQMGFDEKAFTAGIMGLAAKGYLMIERDEDKTFRLVRNKGYGAAEKKLAPDEESLARKLFENESSVHLTNAQHTLLGRAKQALEANLHISMETTFFVTNGRYVWPGIALSVATIITAVAMGGGSLIAVALFMSVWLTGWSFGVYVLVRGVIKAWKSVRADGIGGAAQAITLTLFSIPFVAGECFGIGMLSMSAGLATFSVIAGAISVNVLFHHLLKAPTRAGRQLLDRVEGFKTFLKATEADQLQTIIPPEKTPGLFERFLPFALALGVEQAWAEQFSQVLALAGAAPVNSGAAGYSPSWYSGGGFSSFSSTAFTSSFSSSFSSAISSSSTAPGSSSGSSGGGSSGGGGGGGGGGGW